MDGPTLLVLAAGMGSRYGGLKQIDPMGPHGETLLDYSIYDALKAGFSRVAFVIRRDFEEEFRERVASRYEGRVAMDFAFQELNDLPEGHFGPPGRVKPWGTAHAVWAARGVVGCPFLAINADDFYGGQAYADMATHLRAARDFAMCGYRLGATLSGHGSVSRGVCTVDESDWLVAIREYTKIEKRGDGAAHFGDDGSIERFSGDEAVSLNFWGFTPVVFDLLESLLDEFLRTEGTNEKSECYIPTAVGHWVSQGQARVKVIPTQSPWFGVTYREDKPFVQARLAEYARTGLYPAPLWED